MLVRNQALVANKFYKRSITPFFKYDISTQMATAYRETDNLKFIHPKTSFRINKIYNSNLDPSYVFVFTYKALLT